MQNIRTRTIDGLRKGAFVLVLLLLAANARMAFAHGGFEHVRGTVTKISSQSVTVETTDKKIVEVAINSKTAYARDDKKVAVSDLKVGDRVVIACKGENKKLV